MRPSTYYQRFKSRSEQFWEKVDKSKGNESCWLWTARKNKQGYGQFQSNRAHRTAWELTHGVMLTAADYLCHKCDVPSCVNPAHLFVGSLADNNQDKIAKGRQTRGESHGKPKLIEAQIYQIRNLYLQGWKTPAIAKRFGVSRSTIYGILIGQQWKHITAAIPLKPRARRGEYGPNVRLTTAQVLSIQKLVDAKWSQRKIAQSLGVSRGAVLNILNGSTWKHLKESL